MSQNHYQVLGVDRTTSRDIIKKAYHQLGMKHHPDKVMSPDDIAAATAKFQSVQRASEVLLDDKLRTRYDRENKSHGRPAKPTSVDKAANASSTQSNDAVYQTWKPPAQAQSARTKPSNNWMFTNTMRRTSDGQTHIKSDDGHYVYVGMSTDAGKHSREFSACEAEKEAERVYQRPAGQASDSRAEQMRKKSLAARFDKLRSSTPQTTAAAGRTAGDTQPGLSRPKFTYNNKNNAEPTNSDTPTASAPSINMCSSGGKKTALPAERARYPMNPPPRPPPHPNPEKRAAPATAKGSFDRSSKRTRPGTSGESPRASETDYKYEQSQAETRSVPESLGPQVAPRTGFAKYEYMKDPFAGQENKKRAFAQDLTGERVTKRPKGPVLGWSTKSCSGARGLEQYARDAATIFHVAHNVFMAHYINTKLRTIHETVDSYNGYRGLCLPAAEMRSQDPSKKSKAAASPGRDHGNHPPRF